MSNNRANYTCQERPEATEVNGICVWPDHFVSKHLLAVVIMGVETVSFVKSLSFNYSLLNTCIEEVFDLR